MAEIKNKLQLVQLETNDLKMITELNIPGFEWKVLTSLDQIDTNTPRVFLCSKVNEEIFKQNDITSTPILYSGKISDIVDLEKQSITRVLHISYPKQVIIDCLQKYGELFLRSKMQMKSLNHVAVAVHSIDEYLSLFKDSLGLQYLGIEEVPSQKVKTAFFSAGRGEHIELLEPTSEDSTIYKYLEKKGEGLHHIAFEVDDLESHIQKLKDNGFKMIDNEPRIGAGGMKIAFVHPKSVAGILLELSQPITE